MCWIGETVEEKTMKVASSDIRVRKVLNKDGDNVYSSPISKFYTNKVFTWKMGCEYKTQLSRTERSYGYFLINNGFHSCQKIGMYKSKSKYIKYYWGINSKSLIMRKNDGHVLCDFVIPKGAQYYVNADGEYVSDRIRFIGETSKMKGS